MLTTDRLQYDITGSGEPVLLIHGAAIAPTFVPITRTPSMADRFTLVRYNRRGFTGSEPLDATPTSGQTYASTQVADALSVLEAAGSSLAPGGWFVDHDVHINADKTGPLPAAEYSVFLMHATPGKCWSVGELGGMLEACGFDEVSWRDTAGDRSVVLAHKPD